MELYHDQCILINHPNLSTKLCQGNEITFIRIKAFCQIASGTQYLFFRDNRDKLKYSLYSHQVYDSVPATSDAMPIIGKIFMFVLSICGTALLLSAVVINISWFGGTCKVIHNCNRILPYDQIIWHSTCNF